MRKFVKLQLLCTLVLALMVAGCTGKQTANSDNGPKVLTIGITKDINGFDVHRTGNTLTGSVLVNVFDYLVIKDKDQKIQPGLAVSWANVEPTTWRLKLKQNVKFHNGDPFTAKDVKFSLERIAKDAKFTDNRNYRQIKEVKIVDDYTADIITNGPDPILLNRISRLGSGMLPSKYIEEKGIDEFVKNPVGTGPYKYKEWSKDNRIVLEKNPDYFGGTPKWDQVVFRVIPEESTRVAELLTGGIDIALDIPPADAKRVDNNKGTHVIKAPTKRVLYWIVPTGKPEFKDPRVREAIDLAIDDKAIVDKIYEGGAIPTRTITIAGTPGSETSLYNTSLYDPKRARELLKEAGVENNLQITISSGNGQYLKDKEMTELVGAMLEEVGIKVKLEILETSKFNEKKSAKSFAGLRMNGISSSLNDPASDYGALTSQESTGESDYKNPEFDKIYNHAESNMDLASREKEFQTLQQMIAKDRPIIPLLQLKGIYAVKDIIEFNPRIDEMLYVDEISLKK
ncbi:ABC transporter substrate-binding protein [Paenibacillus sp. LMG 31456]|uniref:ABC transporter substrate-binding protein n=1 Tax=Paenibacillus foliorum TaxID=2654974 RepID=A0A972GXV9_9BACL|nr:ABC transporter substrate-binding protein [Paenibacillus foliorum]NOU96183.1 ABC transporter substrate-binding protein [Paenibacillus foliorum]